MPNWCGNFTRVEGDEAKIKEFKEGVATDNSDFSLEKLVPMPNEDGFLRNEPLGSERVQNKKIIEKYGADNWYDWCRDNWGTKWDARGHLSIDEPNVLGYQYDTAWSPPNEKFWKVVSEKYPELEFVNEYEESGCNFRGTTIAKNGEVNDDYSDWYPQECSYCGHEFRIGDKFATNEDYDYICEECEKGGE